MGEGYARGQGLEFFQISSLQKSEVETPFNHIAQAYHKLYEAKLKALKDEDVIVMN